MAKMKLSKKPYQHGNILNKGKKILLSETLTLKLTPQDKIELEVIHVSITMDVICVS